MIFVTSYEQLIETLNKIKEHIKYDEEEMKFTFEIEIDNFNSSEEWDRFKEVMNCQD